MDNTENVEVEQTENLEPEIEIIDEETVPEESSETEEVKEERKPIIDEDEQRQKKHISLKTKFNQTRREAARVSHENEQLKQEIARLQQVSFRNEDAAMLHYDSKLDTQIQQAKTEKKIALESGDIEAQIAADEKLAAAVSEKTRATEWKQHNENLKKQREQVAQQPEQQQPQYQEPQYDMPEEVGEWVERNSWFLPDSPDYNPEVAQEVQSFSEVLERKYIRQGMDSELYSKQYFDEIDNYIREQILEEPHQEKPQKPTRSQINMKPVRTNVAPVGKSQKAGEGTSRKTVTLSTPEKEMAKIMNLSEQEYAKWKFKDQEKQVAKGFGPGGRTRF